MLIIHIVEYVVVTVLFLVGLGMTCKGFPGPGVMSSLLANPMQEFVEPHGQEKVHELFEHFLIKHPRKYANMVDKKEHNQRRDIFRQNLRYEILYILKNVFVVVESRLCFFTQF